LNTETTGTDSSIKRQLAHIGGNSIVAGNAALFVPHKHIEHRDARSVAIDLEGELRCESIKLREMTTLLLSIVNIVEAGIRESRVHPGLTDVKRHTATSSGGNDYWKGIVRVRAA
jgi:hypothetical protein